MNKVFKLKFIILSILCGILSCTPIKKAYFVTRVDYSVINGKDTIRITSVDTISSLANNSFIAYVSGDSSAVIVNSITNSGDVTELCHREYRTFKYPNCNVVINDFKYKKIRNFDASHWDGKEI